MPALRKPQSPRDWVTLLIGAVWLYFSGQPLLMGLWSLGWDKSPGVITYSQPYRRFRTYRVDLRYTYNYQGREYAGDQYRFMFIVGLDRLRGWQVDAIQARYPVGEAVQVAVNPWRPSQAVLEPGVDLESFLWPAAGLLIALAGLLPGREKRRNQKKSASPAAADANLAMSAGAGGRRKSGSRYYTAKLLALIGALLSLWGMSTLYTGWRSLDWPTTTGRVRYSLARTTGQNYRTQLWYEYHVDGVRYVAEEYRIGGSSTPFKDTARAVAARYPVGRIVKVYYNPSNPAEAVLEPGPWYGNFIIPAIGLLVLGVAFLAKKYADAVALLDARRAQKV